MKNWVKANTFIMNSCKSVSFPLILQKFTLNLSDMFITNHNLFILALLYKHVLLY